MARRGKYNRRRARGRFSFLYKMLCFVVICAVIAVALTLFFKVQDRHVVGNAHYTGDEIVEASGIQIGDNMFLLNKYDVSARITSTLPYVETVQIRRALPDTLVFQVTECTAPAVLVQDGKAWLLSSGGKLVDTAPVNKAEQYAQVTGITAIDPTLGQNMAVSEEQSAALKSLLLFLAEMNERDMLGQTQAIHFEDASQITVRYLDRFDVLIPRNADYAYKLDYLLAVVEKLEINEKGVIDMTRDGRASFIPE